MIFSKSSTRTRVSFEVGMRQLGGGSINLNPNDTQIGRGEPIEDTARVISSMQLLADIQTFQELRGSIKGATFAWVGDGNNVCHSFMNAARLFDFQLNIATPAGFEPDASIIERNRSHLMLTNDAKVAVENVDAVVTDTWASMGQEQEKNEREQAFKNFCVDNTLMSKADKNALFLHCLPAYRGMEVSPEVIDGPQSVVFLEAENRLHAQKALLELLLV